MRSLATALMVALVGSGALAAQRVPEVRYASVTLELPDLNRLTGSLVAAEPAPQVPVVLTMTAGVAGGVTGLYVGAAIGYELGGGGEICGDDPCGFVGGVFGALIGEAIGVAVGTHLGNRARGNLAADLAASIGAVMVAGGFVGGSGLDGRVAIPLVASAQLVATLLAERHTARLRSAPFNTR